MKVWHISQVTWLCNMEKNIESCKIIISEQHSCYDLSLSMITKKQSCIG